MSKSGVIRESHSLPPLRKSPKIGDYIKNSLKYVQKGCYQGGKLQIDGDYGDYRMSIFRLKDRNKHGREIPSIFNRKFVSILQNTAVDDQEHHGDIDKIINMSNEAYQRQWEAGQVREEPAPALMPRGAYQSIREDNDSLLYAYLPKGQEDWFETVDHSEQYTLKKSLSKMHESAMQAPAPNRMAKKVKPKRKHLFKYQDNPETYKSYLF